jgi:CRISPR-associated protein Csd1
VSPSDPTLTAYLLGRLIAVYELIERVSLGRSVDERSRDSIYGAASSQPRQIFPQLADRSQLHLNGLDRRHKRLRQILERRVGEITNALPPGKDRFPSFLLDGQKALFALGYRDERADRVGTEAHNTERMRLAQV